MIYTIIPNYNGLEHLETCLGSLKNQSYNNFKIILVDNNSSDDSVDFTKKNYSDTIILKQGHNLGFSKAVNIGITYALNDRECEYILLINNDIECDKYFLEEILKGFVDEKIGSVGSKMLNFYQRNLFNDTGNFIDPSGYPYKRSFDEEDIGQYNMPQYIFGACAGAAIYKSGVFEKIGLFDEDFFAYYEDVDFSLRMQLAGFKSYYNPKAVCYHKESSTSGKNSDFKIYLVEKNLLLFRLKNYPYKSLILNFPLFTALTIKRFGGYFVKHSPKKFWWALKGFSKGIVQSKKIISKRKELKKIQKVSFDEIKFTP